MGTTLLAGTTRFEAPQLGRRAPGTRVRADALPEFTRYRDDGCDVSSSCLTCPLPRCRYEEPGGLRAILNATRDQEIVQLRLEGMGVDDLADRFGVSRRTVFRVLGTQPQPQQKKSDTRREPTPIRPLAIEAEEREVKYA